MDHFQRSEQIVLNKRRYKHSTLCISLHHLAEDCADTVIVVSAGHSSLPRLPSRIVKCTPNKLVIKGKIAFGKRKPFKLTLRLNKNVKKPEIWWTASLAVNEPGYRHYSLLHENNYEPAPVFSPVTYGDKRLQKGASILHQTSTIIPDASGTFLGWHPESKYYLLYQYSYCQQYLHINECFAVFAAAATSAPYPIDITSPTRAPTALSLE